MIYAIYIINCDGGIIFYKSFDSNKKMDNINDFLKDGSKFYIISQLAQKLSPVKGSSGIQSVEFDNYIVECLSTQTGLQFLCVADQNCVNLRGILSQIYQLYVDYVTKNPFYILNQPIKINEWEYQLETLIKTLII